MHDFPGGVIAAQGGMFPSVPLTPPKNELGLRFWNAEHMAVGIPRLRNACGHQVSVLNPMAFRVHRPSLAAVERHC